MATVKALPMAHSLRNCAAFGCRDFSRKAFAVLVAFFSFQIGALAQVKDGPDVGPQVSFDSTLYGTTNGVSYADMNVTLAPFGGIYETGFRMRFSGYLVGYEYLIDSNTRAFQSGEELLGAFLAGYAVYAPGISAIGLVGVAVSEMNNGGVPRSTAGAVGSVTLDFRPIDRLLLYGQAKYSTISRMYEAQAKVGWKVWNAFYVGPEAKISGLTVPSNSPISTQSIGIHLSAIQWGPVYLGFSGGYVYDNQTQSGTYGGASIFFAF